MTTGRAVLAVVLGVMVGAVGCAHTDAAQAPPPPPPLTARDVERALPARVKDKSGWAEDIVAAIRLTGKEPSAERVCAVAAVIEQESGYQADPPVAGLPAMVRRGIEEKLEPLGPLKGTALSALLDEKPPGHSVTFGERINRLKTERDLDVLFRDIAAAYRGQYPGSFATAKAIAFVLGKRGVDEMNPVTTAGSMQVKVSFAKDLGQGEGLSDDEVRELLYTRGGGVRFGTARLIGYAAAYDDIRFRFADYNSGVYASRNAAFQAQLAAVTGMSLVLDGDVLAYDQSGDVGADSKTLVALLAFGEAHGLSAWRVRRDAQKEKTQAFEETETYQKVRAVYVETTGKPATYAQMPQVTLSSPKLSRPRTTSWFADNVHRRYVACRARLAPPAGQS